MADHSVSRVVKCRVGVEVQVVEALKRRLRRLDFPCSQRGQAGL